jgi:two-component system, chemotaxis family, protein-glutamate methylesterase/glutaminase
MRTIRVLVVDDSAFMRHALGRLLAEAAGIEVVGTAGDGLQGLEAAARLHPDVITLDVEMPNLDGLGMLRRLMLETPTRVVMLSSLTTDGAAVTLDALDSGAIDFTAKPSGSLSINVNAVRDELIAKVRAAAGMSEASFLHYRQMAVARIVRAAPTQKPATPSTTTVQPAARPLVPCRKLVVIASSTGGPGALHTLVSGLPAHVGAALVIVQHMPPGFTASLAGRLDGACVLPVSEAKGGDVLAEDRILLAPGDRHLITSSGGRVQLVQLPPVNGVRPAADVTLESVAPAYRERVLTVVLTGMGSDACRGAGAIKQHGGTVYAQDRETSTIYGMPAAVAEAGFTDRVIPLPRMAAAIAQWARSDAPAGELARAG